VDTGQPNIGAIVAGLFHDFLLLSLAEHPFTSYAKFINDPRAVRLHDDFIGYLLDSLIWLPSYNPAKQEPTTGLCRWGPTIIHTDGAVTACRIFNAWADLFNAGPPILHLTGDWTYLEGEPSNEGAYERLEFDREETVDRLRLLARYADKVAGSGHDLYILHLGV
jgi:hypothetical protein